MVSKDKVRYIEAVLSNKIDLRGKSTSSIDIMLSDYGLDKEKDSYHYLTKMAMDSVSKENVEKLHEQKDTLDKEYEMLFKSSASLLWKEDLNELEPFI